MTLEDRTRAEVTRRVTRLQERYGEFPVDEETVTNEPDRFEEGRQLADAGWIGDAGAWVTDDTDRVLLIRHRSAPEKWGTPGGGHEPGETLAETARREVREETGITCSVTGVYRARRKIIVNDAAPDERVHMLTVEFEADAEDQRVEIGDEEVLEARWFAEPPAQVHDYLTAKIERWEQEQG